jgi:curli biogenesis system outer membrane secretion channel CsgG
VFLASSGAWAQTAAPVGPKTLGVADVKVNEALIRSVTEAGRRNSIGRVAQAMDGQLIAAFNSTRKFRVIARNDLDAILKEQELVGSGNVDAKDASAAKPFKIRGVEHLLVATIDDFQDLTEQANFEAINVRGTHRAITLSIVGKLYNTTTGEIVDTTNFQVKVDQTVQKPQTSTVDAEMTDAMLIKAARDMSEKMANRVVDVIFPARIVARSDGQVTINRGDGTGISAGQVWEVFSLGKELIDPDTGVVLGKEETRIGAIRITSVLPLMAKGEVVEDKGIGAGNIVRPRPAEVK